MHVIGGRYELGAAIGAGGMATVVEGVDRQLGRRVAVKLLDVRGADASLRERFVREARTAATVHHPNVVTVFDAGEDDGTLFIVMERVEGRSLKDVLLDRGRLGSAEATAIVDQVLAGLGAAHSHGLVHRDVKPANVLVADDGIVKLADFGIAKPVDDLASSLTRTGQVIGTVTYLAPEQAAGAPATPRSDVYAAGVVLYELLAGHPPFAFDNPMATMLAHQRDEVPPLADQSPGLPADLVEVVERALAKDPAGRFADAAAMRSALRSPLGAPGRPTAVLPAASTAIDVVTPPGLTAPVAAAGLDRRRGRRRPVGLLLGLAAIALVVALVALAARRDGGERPTLADVAAAGETTTTTVETTTTTSAPPLPLTLGGLADAIAAGPPSSFGEKGEDLLDRLQKVQRASPGKQGEEARKAIEEIEKWMREGDLDPEVGQAAVALLEPLAAPDESRARSGDRDAEDD
ncbi:MAG TPA: serine/threonine-protein kinase [Acidimicrobiales bacterium]|nr:serine/threonine-protein kinase [Acidimicrobiales bacterium]